MSTKSIVGLADDFMKFQTPFGLSNDVLFRSILLEMENQFSSTGSSIDWILGVIKVIGFSKCYDQFVAVNDLSFRVAAGEILGLVGRNGAGKTTTLRSINGIIPATDGQIHVDGFSLEASPIELKQRTAYVPDDPKLFEDLTVQQHLQFQASVYSVKAPTDRIAQLLEMFELTDKRHERASALSRGMRQKLAICCAYLQRPKALLLDEPMTGLDPQGIRVLKQSIQEQAASGAAVVISSHLLAMVEDICTHVLVLDKGRSKFHGSMSDLQQQFSSDEMSASQSLEQAFFSTLSDAQVAVDAELNPRATGFSLLGNVQTTFDETNASPLTTKAE
jgi:ABC-2 type transport system ATP-binding protein